MALQLNLGNDEVYYTIYGDQLQWSYFDHPLIIGVLSWLGSHLSFLPEDLDYRMLPIIFGTCTSFIARSIAFKISKDKWVANLTLIAFSSSFYVQIVSGLFLMPDVTFLFFWMAALFVGIQLVSEESRSLSKWLLFGFLVGLTTLSKYYGIFLWGGMLLYLVMHERSSIRSGRFLLGIGVSIAVILPILLWNSQNEWVSFLFHSARGAGGELKFHFDYLLQELLGSLAYNNPINAGLILFAGFIIIRKKDLSKSEKYLVLSGVLLIAFFLFNAFFVRTLPHWSGAGYSTLLIVAVVKLKEVKFASSLVFSSFALFAIAGGLSVMVIQQGWLLPMKIAEISEQQGKDDFTLDLYGWDQLSQGLHTTRFELVKNGSLQHDSPVAATHWFPSAHLYHYCIRNSDLRMWAAGDTTNLHQFKWMDRFNEPPACGENALYFTTTRPFRQPESRLAEKFNSVVKIDSIPIYRDADHPVGYGFVFLLEGYRCQ